MIENLKALKTEEMKITFFEQVRDETTLILETKEKNRIHLITFIRQGTFIVQLYLDDERITEEIRVSLSKFANSIIEWYQEESKLRLDFVVGNVKNIACHEYIIRDLERYKMYVNTDKLISMKSELEEVFIENFEDGKNKASYFPKDRIALIGEDGKKLADCLQKWNITDYRPINLDYCPKNTYLLLESDKWNISSVADRLKELGFGIVLIQGSI